MNKFVKTLLGLGIIIIPLLVVMLFLFNAMSKKSFYPTSGTIKVDGVDSKVKMYFDDYGVPHIFAENEKDMYFAMGYMHAQDRLWQMDITRRVAEGRLAEIMGTKVLVFDKLFRTIGINRFAYSWYNNLSQKSKDILHAYSLGVNKFIETHQSNMPVEFDALNYRPEPWKPEHSLMIGRLMGWDLNIAWYTDYIFGEIVNKVGLEKAGEIFPDTSIAFYKKPEVKKDSTNIDEVSSIINSAATEKFKLTSTLGSGFFEANQKYRKLFGIDCAHTGSNAWVVSGERSLTGKPLLANDPHLAFQAPSKWYEMQISDNTTDVRGMTIAGVPAVIIGNNRFIAWGMTNLMNDDNDFFILKRDSVDEQKYTFKNQQYRLDTLTDFIKVKDSVDAELLIESTKLGPVVSNLSVRGFASFGSPEPDNDQYKDRVLTFKWTGSEYTDDISTFSRINNARNWNEFCDALKAFNTPASNFIYADVNGNIGYHAAGKVPIRKASTPNSYIIPSTGDLEWEGYVDFDKLPNDYNPKSGYLLTANTNPFDYLKAEPKNRYYISYIWEQSSRFDKIKSFLDVKTKFDLDEFQLMQMSYQSPYAKEIAKYITDAFKYYSGSDNDIKWCIERFKNWDGEMKSSEPMGSVYNAFYTYLLRNTFADELGPKVFYDFLVVQNMPYRTMLNLMRNENSPWFDNINTAGIVEKRDDIIRKSLMDAIEFLKTKFVNQDINTWSWGELHKVKFRHPLGIVPAFDNTFNIGPFDIGGDQTTINNSEYSFNDVMQYGEFNNILGPSMRVLVNMADPEHPLSVNSTGQSGQPMHQNYQDQARLWQFGEYKQNTMNESEMINNNYKLLTLIPSK